MFIKVWGGAGMERKFPQNFLDAMRHQEYKEKEDVCGSMFMLLLSCHMLQLVDEKRFRLFLLSLARQS
jgi:hypothetical protein